MPPLPAPITSRTNARVKALRASLSGEASHSGDLLGVEGLHLIGELHKCGHSFNTTYVREGSETLLEQGWPASLRTKEWARLSREVFDSAVSTLAPQGIAATWVIDEPHVTIASSRLSGNVLVLENIQDPGNLGTLIRSAEAFGFSGLLITPSTANQWNPKVVRASAGSVFRVPLQRLPLEAIATQLRSGGVRLFAAVSDFLSGLTCGTPAMRQPNGVLTGPNANGDHTSLAQRSAKGYAASLAHDADFIEPCAILIGNEGAGLSDKARALADEQVLIPCHAESLNAAVAGSVLMYEVMRQAPLRLWARTQGLRP